MHIRLATEHDICAISAITNHAIHNTRAHFATNDIAEADDLADFHRTSSQFPWLVAIEHTGSADDSTRIEQCVGFARANLWQGRCAYDWSVMLGVYVHHEHYRKGIGAALYAMAIPILKAQRYRTVIAGITLPNEASVRLHESAGFVRLGVFERIGYKLGEWCDVGYWQLHLRDDVSAPQPVLDVASACALIEEARTL